MPSFDFSSEVDMVALKNAIDVTGKKIIGRHDFKGTSAQVELSDKDKLITLFADSEFQLKQIKDILYPEMEKKEPDCVKRLDDQTIQKVSGDKVKQELKIKIGIESELAKKIVKLLKENKMKAQGAIQGDVVRVTGPKKDTLQEVITLVKKTITEVPLQFRNFRD